MNGIKLNTNTRNPFQGGFLEIIVNSDNSFTIKYFDKRGTEFYIKNTFTNIQYGDKLTFNGTQWIFNDLDIPVKLQNLPKDNATVGILSVYDQYAI